MKIIPDSRRTTGASDSNKPGYYSGVAVWESSFAVDPRRGLLHVDTGNNYGVPAGVCTTPEQTGCTPPAADDYVDSIVALKLRDGAVAWADKTLNSDMWTLLRPIGPYAGKTVTGGSWTALDPATGKILWQTHDPQGAIDASFVSAANGVVYGGSLAATGTDMYALDAATGKILWSFASGGSVTGGAAIVGGSI